MYHHHNKQAVPSPESAAAADIFEQLCAASTFKSVLHHYRHLCDVLRLKPTNFRHFYPKLKSKLRSWKAQALWSKFDKRTSHKCYNHGKACSNSKVLIIGAGPCGLRSAIEAQLLGAKVVVVEKRDRFSRNNVLHLWPFVISDLKQLGAKKFYGKFCAGAIDHISIRQLQCILLKVALLLGVEVFESVSFEELVEPPEDQSEKIGWRVRLSPPDHPANQYEFDVLLGADGKRNTLHGFKRKEFRGKLAIAITANFINKRTEAEARVQEISGVAFIFNQKFFKELYAATGIDLENIVYYKDETHYFVMTAKKHSLIDKGVILNDLPDTQQLLHTSNVDRNALLDYAREAADFSTNYQLPHLDFAVNHYGKPDVAMFDFTSMFAAENACRMLERKGHKLLAGLVGDTLLEPFWPTGSGCARGFLGCFDAAWMIRSWCSGKMMTLEVLAERESIYRLLAQTTPENLSKDHSSYTLDPVSRYPTINLRAVLPFQVRSLYDTDDPVHLEEVTNPHLINSEELPKKRKRRDSFIHPDTLLLWCKKQVAMYSSIHVENMTTSFKDGRALCAVIHRYRPDLIDFESLKPDDIAQNNQLAFDILERDFGVPPVMTGAEMAECEVPDKLSMISYVSQIYDVFRGEIPHFKYPKMDDGEMEVPEPCSLAQRSTPHVNILKNLTNAAQGTPSSRKRMSLERGTAKRDDGRITCRLIDDAGVSVADKKLESLKRTKKRKSEKVTSPQDDIESHQRHQEILSNRMEQLRKQKERRELDNVRFIRSMQMLQCGIIDQSAIQPSYNRDEDVGITEYRKNCVKTMREKAQDLERKLNHRPERLAAEDYVRKVQVEHTEDFTDKVKDLEAKFTASSNTHASDKKPRDLIRAIGKIEKSDWNMVAIEKKIQENKFGLEMHGEREKVPKWNRDTYDDKFHNIERRLRENGEDEETIAKYRDIDTSLKRLEMKLREGSTLETGMRGQNKVSNLASQLSSKLEKKEPEKVLISRQPSRPTVPLPSSGSDLCHFCGNRVYLVERLSAEGKFFHRQCFKCDYCAANLRLGNYIYDREGRYGGKFFCIPHFGLTPRVRGLRRRTDDNDSAKENIVPHVITSTPKLQVPVVVGGEASGALAGSIGVGKGGTHIGISPEDRGTTPERVEFENSVVEQSDEEEYLSEDEWTDRNFGASANELDDSNGEDDSDYSDLSDEEVEDEEMEYLDGGGTLTAAQTRRLAESWQRRYSTDHLDDEDEDEGGSGHESESDLDSDNYSEEYGAEGDESHTATEGEGGEDDDDDEDEDEAVRRARELRRMEVNIDVAAPPRKAETSDSGSDTEVASDEESEESDTQIDTDSEFAEDHVQPGPPKEIPTIIINESQDMQQETNLSPSVDQVKEGKGQDHGGVTEVRGEPRTDFVSQKVDLGMLDSKEVSDKDWIKENGEKSASLTNLNETVKTNTRAEQLKRLLQRTDSTEAIAAQRALQLKRQYLLGENVNLPRKSVSTADLGSRFKSFMDKISETQKMLNPAPQPSAAMQAFMSSSVSSPRSPASSPSSPQLPARSISLPQGDNTSDSTNAGNADTDVASTKSSIEMECQKPKEGITTPIESSVYPVDNEEIQLRAVDQLKGFTVSGEHTAADEEAIGEPEEGLNRIPVSESSSETRSSASSENESDYDNVPSGCKWSFPKKSPTAIEIQKHVVIGLKDNSVCDTVVNTNSDLIDKPAADSVNKSKSNISSAEDLEVEVEVKSDKGKVNDHEDINASDEEGIDEFGLSVPGESEGVETVNRELVSVNAPRSLESQNIECPKILKEEITPVCVHSEFCEVEKDSDIGDNVDELFNILASDALEDIEKFSELVEASDTNASGLSFCDLNSKNTDTLNSQGLLVYDNEKLETSEKRNELIEPIVEIIVENSKVVENQENKQEKLFLGRTVGDTDETKQVLTKEILSSPEEGKENTETELSDWAGENDGISAGEDLEVEVNEIDRLPVRKDSSKTVARIASEESLGDTDSAISTGPNITTSVPSKPCVLADLEGIEFMDTSESASSPDDISHKKQGYRKLEEETPTTPIAPQICLTDLESVKVQDPVSSESKSSESTSTELEDTSQSSVQEAPHNMAEPDNKKDQQKVIESRSPTLDQSKSMSEPPSLNESKQKVNGERCDSFDEYTSPKRYEGYIPRFKERMSPFGYVRDSLDIQKNSPKSSLYTPSKKDVEEREKNEEQLAQLTVLNGSSENKPSVSPNTAKKQIEKSLKSKDKEKEKDLIKELVMSRISRKNSEKTSRRGSRTSVSPLSSTGSRTSLFTPQSSQENLLDKVDNLVKENDKKEEVLERKPIHVDSRRLLRLESLKPDLPESGQTFSAEEKRAKVRVGSIFRDDSVLGSPTKGDSLQDVSVPFADESQDEEVFEKTDQKQSGKKACNQSSLDKNTATVHVTSTEPSFPTCMNLPATPLTHPEHFDSVHPKRELFKVPSVPVPVTPLRRHHTSGSEGISTPVSSERPLSTPNLSTIERERAREEARIRARLKTDLDLGLSPPDFADNLRVKLRKSSMSENEAEKEEKVKEVSSLASQTAVSSQGIEELTLKNKDERVKELLAEQRQHRQRDPDGQQEEWNSKDDRVREKLEEYRQRRRGSTRSCENGDSRPSGQLLRRHTHRPSLLELESLQVFTASPSKGSSVSSSSIGDNTTNASTSTSPASSATSAVLQSNLVPPSSSTSGASSLNATPASQPSQESASSEKTSEKKSGKKSKDRERRRSLIQVFAGMFSKSGDEKKKSEQQSQPSDITDSVTASKATVSSVLPATTAPVDKPKSAPKSPSTVRDKLSKLRLSRSKEKKKVDKGRSSSADILDDLGNTDDTRVAFSLPTSPSRRPIPFLSSPFTKASPPPQASEESLSDDDGGSTADTPAGTLERGLHASFSGSTSRKHRNAAFKAARQAELKRLRMAQEIQRQLEECEVKTRELEERGVAVEKALRGEGGGANRDEADLMGDWFSMVHEKNALVRWEQELMVRAKELELEDRHVRLEHELKHRMALSEHEKSREDIDREGTILAEMLSILEQKDALVTMMEEDRQRYMEEDRDLESVMLRKGLQLSPLRRETGV